MTIVSTPPDDLLFFISLGGSITLQRRRGGRYGTKIYLGTKKRKVTLDPFYRLIFNNQKQLWSGLSQSEKDNWNNKGQTYGMTGEELYIQEGWKSNLSAVYHLGRYKQSYYGAGIT